MAAAALLIQTPVSETAELTAAATTAMTPAGTSTPPQRHLAGLPELRRLAADRYRSRATTSTATNTRCIAFSASATSPATNAVWTDVVYPIGLSRSDWSIFPGYEDLGFLPALRAGETMRIAIGGTASRTAGGADLPG